MENSEEEEEATRDNHDEGVDNEVDKWNNFFYAIHFTSF